MNAHCGGCRARAYGMTGDLMAEDPLCTHIPGKFAGSPFSPSAAVRPSRGRRELPRVTVDELNRIRSRMPTPKFFG